MKEYQDYLEIKFSEDDSTIKELIITNKKAPIVVVGILGFFMILSFLLPIIATLIIALEGDGLHFGLLFGYILGWLAGRWMLKMILWNRVGREHFKFSKSKVQYIADYKWFKDKPVTFKTENLEFGIIDVGDSDEKLGYLIFENGNNTIESVIKVPIEYLEAIFPNLPKNV